MGLLNRDVSLLIQLSKSHVFPVRRILTLGRLKLRLSKRFMSILSNTYPSFISSGEMYAENLLSLIFDGAEVVTLDFSNYEGCSFVHDLNEPLVCDDKFDLVLDGGTLEHVFNIGIAMRSVNGLLNSNGILFISSMCNNHCGHGLYQFSIDFFRSFSNYFGYVDNKVIVSPSLFPGQELFQLNFGFEWKIDSSQNSRAVLHTFLPYGINFIGRKPVSVSNADGWPIQSDYKSQGCNSGDRSGSKFLARSALITGLRQYLKRFILFNKNVRFVKFF